MAATWIEEPLDLASGPPTTSSSKAGRGPRHLRVSRPSTHRLDRRPPAAPLAGSDFPGRLGQHPLLTAADEVELAGRIEAGVLAAERPPRTQVWT